MAYTVDLESTTPGATIILDGTSTVAGGPGDLFGYWRTAHSPDPDGIGEIRLGLTVNDVLWDVGSYGFHLTACDCMGCEPARSAAEVSISAE